jgi:hypothetical protein
MQPLASAAPVEIAIPSARTVQVILVYMPRSFVTAVKSAAALFVPGANA